MTKLFIFFGVMYLTGSPIIAVLVLLAILYFIDRRFIGLTPSITRPLKRNRRLSQLKQELFTQLHNTSGKLEAAWLLIEKKKYREALVYLEEVRLVLDDSADALYAYGLCYLKLGDLALGEKWMLQSLELNPRVKYGEAYLRLGEALSIVEPERALAYLQKFREMQSSSCEAYYRLGQLYRRLRRVDEARNTFAETLLIYRTLPRYKRRTERRWAILAWWKKLQS
ncbi:MAG: repeat-containing protein [Bacilli bacterium]|nr:repeat-containing protein [Bacilli bacterium]